MGQNAAQQLVVQIVGDIADFKSKGGDTEQLLKNLETRFASLGTAGEIAGGAIAASTGRIATGVATAGVAILALAVKAEQMAARVDSALRQVGASSPALRSNLQGVRDDIESVAKTSGRSRDEIYSAAEQISRLGVASEAEFKQKLDAATLIADATGTELTTAVDGVDQIADAFDLSADQIVKAMAKISSASAGKVDFASIFGALQAATPRIEKLGLDFDTAVRATTVLLDRGFTAKKVGQYFNDHSADALREVAKQANIAADALKKFEESGDFARGGPGREWTRVLNEFNAALAAAGTDLLPPVTAGLKGIATLIDEIAQRKLGASLGIGTATDPYQVFKSAHPWGTSNDAVASLVQSRLTGNPTPTLATPPAPRKPLPLSEAEEQALKDAKQAAAEANAEFEQLAATTEQSKSKSDEFADAIGKWAAKALKATTDLATFDAQLNKLQGILKGLRRDEALDKQAKAAKESADAWRALDDAFSKVSSSAIAQFDQQMEDQFASLGEQAKKITDPDQLLAYLDWLDDLKKKYGELRKAVVDADGVQKLLNDDLDRLAGLKPGLDQLVKALDAKEAARQHAQELAQAWDAVGRSIIAAGQAVGGFDDKTAAALQNAVSLGHGIFDLATGKIGQGIAESVSSLAALGKSLFGGDSAADKEHQRIIEANTNALQTLVNQIQLGKVGADYNGLSHPQFTAAQRWLDMITAANGGSLFNDFPNGLPLQGTPDYAAAVEAAKALGITLDGSVDSLAKFRQGLQTLQPAIEAAYEEQQLQLQQDLHIRLLRAQGFATEADAEALEIQQKRELADAIKNGADETTQAALAAAQAAEAQHALADAERQAAENSLSAAESTASGDIAIHDVTNPAAIFTTKARDYAKGVGGSLGDLLKSFNLDDTSPQNIAAINAEIVKFYDTLHDGTTTVDLAGLSVDDLDKVLLDLHDAANATAAAVQSATDAFNESTQKLSSHERIFGTDPSKHAKDTAAAGGINLDDYNLSTKAGHDSAIALLQYLATKNPAMESVYAAIADAVNAVPIIESSGGAVTGAVTGAAASKDQSIGGVVLNTTIEQADKMISLETAHLAVLREHTSLFIDIRALLSETAGYVTVPPQIPSLWSAGSGGDVTINLEQTFNGPVGATDRAAARQLAGYTLEELVDKLDRLFAVRYKNTKLRVGNTVQS